MVNKKKIIFWVVLTAAILVKFIHIDQPILEGYVGRQIATATVTRNLLRGASVFYPELDTAPFPAYCMLELPVYNIIVAAFYKIFGINEMFGRLVSIFSIIIATFFLFKIVKKYFGLDVAFLSSIFFNILPVSIIYGRAFQPDSLMMLALLGGFYFLDNWTDNKKTAYILIAAGLFSLAFLIKLVSLYVFLPILFLFWQKDKFKFFSNAWFWVFVLISLVPSAVWYTHARAVALSPEFTRAAKYGPPVWSITQRWLSPSAWFNPVYYKAFIKIFFGALLTPVGFVLFLLGALKKTTDKRQIFFYFYALSLFIYSFILMRKMNLEYYYLGYLPVASVFIARGIEACATSEFFKKEFFANRMILFLGAFIFALFIFIYSIKGVATPDYLKNISHIAERVRGNTSEDELIITSSPPILYYADRKGFIFEYYPERIENAVFLWKEEIAEPTPEGLLDFFRKKGGVLFVENVHENNKPFTDFFDYVAKNFKTIEYKPGQFIISRVWKR